MTFKSTPPVLNARAALLLITAAFLQACQAPGEGTIRETPSPAGAAEIDPADSEAVMFSVRSAAFADGGPIPGQYSCDGENASPPLAWGEPPAGTKSFLLIMDDPDAPGRTWVHWIVFNLPADARGLPEGISRNQTPGPSGVGGANSWGGLGYGGPCPPGGTHRYFFKLYALEQEVDLGPGASKENLLAAAEGHILAEAQWMGTYSR